MQIFYYLAFMKPVSPFLALSLSFSTAFFNVPSHAQTITSEEHSLRGQLSQLAYVEKFETFIDESGNYKPEQMVGPMWYAEFETLWTSDEGLSERKISHYNRLQLFSLFLNQKESGKSISIYGFDDLERGVQAMQQQPCTAKAYQYYSRKLEFGLASKGDFYLTGESTPEDRFTVNDICLTFG
jgi:hypothetical protein